MPPSKTSNAIAVLIAGIFSCALAALAPPADGATETVLYSFQNNGKDGLIPDANLVYINGFLYGTTEYGGDRNCYADGCGVIFSVSATTGAETVLYRFRGAGLYRESTLPESLIEAGGSLFGTTRAGGRRDAGVLFSFDPQSLAFKQRYYFCNLYNCVDGQDPNSGLLNSKGTLYGTTEDGPLDCEEGTSCGVAFSFDPKTQIETVLYTFCSQQNCTDGAYPEGGLLSVKGVLYGATGQGGTGSNCPYYEPYECGTVFSLDPSTGVESAIYSFCSQLNCADGNGPNGNLINLGQTLYGTTVNGGTSNLGTVFSLHSPNGHETVLHSFGGNSDGAGPNGGLIEINGTFYGTTFHGGGSGCDYSEGCGTVFSVDPDTGAEAVVYSFCSQANCADGAYPSGSLLSVNGTLYGVTQYGGSGSCVSGNEPNGCGTVFAITP
ncbi:MAG TPA: choice-of-anchor tandem repeat GloVer-containing protein [Rhizomicrobium sp.]|nr:choice-of-anchor tandem repeat GloVer-containing protein [Rhizomicrobium sp.]